VVKLVDNRQIAANDYNLSVSSYVEAKDNREVIDIKQINEELKIIQAKNEANRAEWDKLITYCENLFLR
jgi:type I restriction enzyme M protein